MAVLAEQKKAFIEKFGREPRENEPVFFDPNADEPREMDPGRERSTQGHG